MARKDKEQEQKQLVQIHCKHDAMLDPKELQDHPRNANKHSKEQIDALSDLYLYHGVRHPIIVSRLSGFIVAGHGRKAAAIRAKIKEYPVVYQDFENDDKEYAFLQADNAIALWAELDIKRIKNDLMQMPDLDKKWLGIKDFELNTADFEDPKGQKSKELEEKTDYIVLTFHDKDRFKDVCSALGLEQVYFNSSRSQSPAYFQMGIGRIVDGEEAATRLGL